MRKYSPLSWMRYIRCIFVSSIMVTLMISFPNYVRAADGPIYVAGVKLSQLYRFKQGVKYLPVESVTRALGLGAHKSDGVWTISNSWKGEISVNEKSSRVLSRDNTDFVCVEFWSEVMGLEIIELGDNVYVFNKIVDVTEMSDGILIKTAAPLKYNTFNLDNPMRTVFDFDQLSTANAKKEIKYSYDNMPFTSVRIGQFESFPHVARVVIDHSDNSSQTLETGVYGVNRNLFWIGKTKYVDLDSPIKTPGKQIALPKDNLIAIGYEGNVLVGGLNFSSVNKSMLIDRKPFRAVFDLMDCKVPFKEERVYEGRGATENVRIYGHDKHVRIVVEFSEFLDVDYEITDDGSLHIFYISAGAVGIKEGLKVLIDPGHGGKDPGAVVTKDKMGGLSAQEKDINLNMAFELGRILTERGVKVFYTRTDDRFIELSARRDMATHLGVDLMVSIHNNSTITHPQSFLSGPEVYYHYARDKELAQNIWQFMSWRTGVSGRGIFFCRLAVTMNPKVPSVLVEAAYLNNPSDLARLLDPNGVYARNAMLGIVDGIAKTFPGKMTASQVNQIQKPTIPASERSEQAPERDLETIPDKHSPRTGFRERYSSLELDSNDILPLSTNLLSRGGTQSRIDNIFQFDSSNYDKPVSSDYSSKELLRLAPLETEKKISDITNEKASEILSPQIVVPEFNIKERDRQEKKENWEDEEIEQIRNNIFKLSG